MTIVWALARSGLTVTCAEARRLVCLGAVKVDGQIVKDIEHIVSGVITITIGKSKEQVVDTSTLTTRVQSG